MPTLYLKVCDACGKKETLTQPHGGPKGWVQAFVIDQQGNPDHETLACSWGCAEKAARSKAKVDA
jgi:hypothetical protein